MAVPSTGVSWLAGYQPTIQPLATRYWQITGALIRDYLNVNGTVNNLGAASAGLDGNGNFTAFAQDGNFRGDLLYSATGSNQGFYPTGDLKEDVMAVDPQLSVQETMTSSSIRSTRNVFTKLGDKVTITPLESNPVVDYLRFEFPLLGDASRSINPVPDIGTFPYSLARQPTDLLCERQLILLGVDGDGQLMAKIFPRLALSKRGKEAMQRKTPEELDIEWDILTCPYAKTPEITCRSGVSWQALGGAPTFGGSAPVATAISSSKATIAFTTPTGIDAPFTYTVAQQVGGSGAFTASVLQGSPSVSGSTTTLTVGSGLTTSSAYVFQVTATGTNGAAATSANSNSITST